MEIEGIVLITSSLSLRGALTHNDVNEQSPCPQATRRGFFTWMNKQWTHGKTVQNEECGGGLVRESSFSGMSLERSLGGVGVREEIRATSGRQSDVVGAP